MRMILTGMVESWKTLSRKRPSTRQSWDPRAQATVSASTRRWLPSSSASSATPRSAARRRIDDPHDRSGHPKSFARRVAMLVFPVQVDPVKQTIMPMPKHTGGVAVAAACLTGAVPAKTGRQVRFPSPVIPSERRRRTLRPPARLGPRSAFGWTGAASAPTRAGGLRQIRSPAPGPRSESGATRR